jgi:HK97 family phage prohead protease
MEKSGHIIQAKALKAVNSNTIKFRLTELRVDRHGEVVVPEGIILDTYKSNPVVLYGHGWDLMQGDIPIGKIDPESFDINKEYVDANVVFDVENDPFAKMIYRKVKDKFLNSGSIGFRPIEILKEAVLDGQKGDTITKWELMEFSIVPFPANIGAIALNSWNEYKQDVFMQKGINIDPLNQIEEMKKETDNIKRIEDKLDNLKDIIQGISDSLSDINSAPTPENDEELNKAMDELNTAIHMLNNFEV